MGSSKKKKYKHFGDDIKSPSLGLDVFVKDFINSINNPIIMSMFYRMLDTNKFTKFGTEIYTFTDEEKEKLKKIKPLFDSLVDIVSKIKNIEQNG